MRRYGIVLCIMTVFGCREAFMAHGDVVARADRTELTVTRLAELLAAVRQIPLDRGVVDALARNWVELTLFAHRTAQGDAFLDSTTVVRAMWPELHQAVVDSFYTVHVATRVSVEPAQVDSAYRAGNLRFLAHILRTVPAQAAPEVRERQRAEANRIHDRLLAGGTWEEANQFNQDTLARARGGLLGPILRGSTVPRFENAAYALNPGEISPVTETSFGYHIIFRPELRDIREEYADAVRRVLVARVDSAYERDLLEAKAVEVRPGAPATMRATGVDPYRARDLDKVIATYTGGRFTVRDLVRWVKMMDPQVVRRFASTPDDQLVQLAQSLIAQQLLYEEADSAGIGLTPDLFGSLIDGFAAQLVQIRAAMRVHPDSLGGAEATRQERERIADLLVNAYLEAALKSQVPFVSIPPFFAEQLLEQGDWEVKASGVERSIERAADMRAAMPGDTATGQQ
jgi:parvulin-like peptidyl-prolyl isomerase